MASLELTEQPAMTMQEERLARNFAEFDQYVQRAQGYLAHGETSQGLACELCANLTNQGRTSRIKLNIKRAEKPDQIELPDPQRNRTKLPVTLPVRSPKP